MFLPRVSAGSSLKLLKDPDTIDLENKISEKLGMTININHKGKKGGSIKIDYKTLDQLEMITQKLKN